jgi:glutamine---fructose-6-phosphate transaminase (isomerizing)
MVNSEGKLENSATWNEILSQPRVWQELLRQPDLLAQMDAILEQSAKREKWIFVGCGTSYYLAEAAAVTFMSLTGRPARSLPGSEVVLQPDLVRAEGNNLQAVVISRSGKTSEAVRAAGVLRNDLRIPTIGITCAENSALEQACERSLVLRAADEMSTVMTRSFTGMLITLQSLAAKRARKPEFVEQLREMAERFGAQIAGIAGQIESFVKRQSFSDYVFLGQGAFHGIAREAALKVMEMSCSYSQFFHALEFRHGPKAIVSPETCLTFYLSETGYKAEAEVLAEMKELGGVIVAICNHASESVKRASDLLVELKLPVNELALLAPYVVPSQLMGFFTGTRKGLNPDAPKNLTRVVMLD